MYHDKSGYFFYIPPRTVRLDAILSFLHMEKIIIHLLVFLEHLKKLQQRATVSARMDGRKGRSCVHRGQTIDIPRGLVATSALQHVDITADIRHVPLS